MLFPAPGFAAAPAPAHSLFMKSTLSWLSFTTSCAHVRIWRCISCSPTLTSTCNCVPVSTGDVTEHGTNGLSGTHKSSQIRRCLYLRAP